MFAPAVTCRQGNLRVEIHFVCSLGEEPLPILGCSWMPYCLNKLLSNSRRAHVEENASSTLVSDYGRYIHTGFRYQKYNE